MGSVEEARAVAGWVAGAGPEGTPPWRLGNNEESWQH